MNTDIVIDSWVPDAMKCEIEDPDSREMELLDAVDLAATKHSNQEGMLSISLVNRHPDRKAVVQLHLNGSLEYNGAKLYGVTADSKDAYNDIGRDEIRKTEEAIAVKDGRSLTTELRPHSVYVLELK